MFFWFGYGLGYGYGMVTVIGGFSADFTWDNPMECPMDCPLDIPADSKTGAGMAPPRLVTVYRSRRSRFSIMRRRASSAGPLSASKYNLWSIRERATAAPSFWPVKCACASAGVTYSPARNGVYGRLSWRNALFFILSPPSSIELRSSAGKVCLRYSM